MSFAGITDANGAIAYIIANPGMSTADLKALANQMDVSIDSDTLKLTYSGNIVISSILGRSTSICPDSIRRKTITSDTSCKAEGICTS